MLLICSKKDPQGQQSKADFQHKKLVEKMKEIDPAA
jgi:hypothetical protein